MSFVESETISIAFPIFAVKGQKNLNKLFRKCPLFEYKKNVEKQLLIKDLLFDVLTEKQT